MVSPSEPAQAGPDRWIEAKACQFGRDAMKADRSEQR